MMTWRRKKSKIANGSEWIVTYKYLGLCWCEKMNSAQYRECLYNEDTEIIHAKKVK